MSIKLGVVMDPIQTIDPRRDSTLVILLAAQARGWQLYYMEPKNLFIQDAIPKAQAKELSVFNNHQHWFDFIGETTIDLAELDVILMRKDPPFDMEYIYTTYLLELAEAQETLIINKPQSLRDANEKLSTLWFPELCPPNIVTKNTNLLRDFITEQQDTILKPLHSMDGDNIFHLRQNDPNTNSIIENLTHNGSKFIMAQRYLPEITAGDKRIIMINGEPIPKVLARFAAPGEIRIDILSGGSYKIQKLTERDLTICRKIGPILRDKGLYLAGIDIIGDYLTEINVTSPGYLGTIEKLTRIKITQKLLDFIETTI